MAKAALHPQSHLVQFTCTGCGNKFSIPSTMSDDTFQVEHCNECHRVYTGISTVAKSDAISKFNKRYNRRPATKQQGDK